MSKKDPFDLVRGIFLLLACNIGYCVVVWFLPWIPFVNSAIVWLFQDDEYGPLGFLIVAILATGLVQLLYAIPLYNRYKRVGRPEVSKGIAIAAGFTFFLSASCFLAGITTT